MQPMVTINKQLLVDGFSSRLNEACDDAGWPSFGRGNRAVVLVSKLPTELKVTVNAAKKWFNGQGMPESIKIGHISNILNVSQEWLTTGKGEKIPHQLKINNVISNSEVSSQNLKENIDTKTKRAIDCLISPPKGRESIIDHLKDVLIDIWGEKTAKTFVDLNSKQDTNHSELDK